MKPELKALKEQIIVVTGASSGIGMATALAAAHEGAKVVLAARSEATLQQIAEHINSAGGAALAVAADVSDRAQVENVARQAIERFGRIDTWVNNAGVSIYGRLDEVKDADSRRLFDINYWGIVNGSLTALPHLKKNQGGGALINVGSEVSDAFVPLQGMYSASKHAVQGFTDALRVELDADEAPISVTLIQPTAVNTPYPEHAANYLSQEPMLPTPMIEPEKVASAILDAATDPVRDVKVGAMSKLNTTLAKVLPSLFDVMAKKQIGRQQRAESPQHAREGTLYQGGESGRTHGRGAERSADSDAATAANTRPAR